MEDAHLVAAVATRLIRRYGSKSLDAIAELREKAVAMGDKPSVQTWLDITAAAETLLAAHSTQANHLIVPAHSPWQRSAAREWDVVGTERLPTQSVSLSKDALPVMPFPPLGP